MASRQRVQQPPQSGQGVLGGGLFAGLHLHVQNQPRRARQVGVIDMGGPAAFVWVAAHFRAFLVAIDGFDGRVDVRNSRHAQERAVAFAQMPLLPAGHGGFRLGLTVPLGQGAAQRISAQYLPHAQQRRVDTISAEGRDMRIAVNRPCRPAVWRSRPPWWYANRAGLIWPEAEANGHLCWAETSWVAASVDRAPRYSPGAFVHADLSGWMVSD